MASAASDGARSRTLLGYAEEQGLLTGVITTQSIADATPAAPLEGVATGEPRIAVPPGRALEIAEPALEGVARTPRVRIVSTAGYANVEAAQRPHATLIARQGSA